ncbi:MAG: hypothetical protein ACYTG3_16170 [Planctomycetota bacterium]|jgi:hypothetical protein
MRWGVLILLAAAAGAQEPPEPGRVPTDIVTPGDLTVAPQPGDAKKALATFVAAHKKHKRGDEDGALRGYLLFLGMPGREELPPRYVATVERRVAALRANVRKRYDEALALYRKDGGRGIAALRKLADRYAALPEGRAARVLVHSDALKAAIEAARAAKDKRAAAAALMNAVRKWTAAEYLYEAKRLLLDLGGPDLFAPRKRADPGSSKEKKEPEKEKEPEIEVSDD